MLNKRKISDEIDFSDARSETRILVIPLRLPIRVQFGKSNLDEPVDAIILDISIEGTCLFSKTPLVKDAGVCLRWAWPGGEAIKISGKVKYSKRYKNKSYSGIQFIDAEPELLHIIKIKNIITDHLKCERRLRKSLGGFCEICRSYSFCTKSVKKKVDEFKETTIS